MVQRPVERAAQLAQCLSFAGHVPWRDAVITHQRHATFVGSSLRRKSLHCYHATVIQRKKMWHIGSDCGAGRPPSGGSLEKAVGVLQVMAVSPERHRYEEAWSFALS